jgi:hypothetical protein
MCNRRRDATAKQGTILQPIDRLGIGDFGIRIVKFQKIHTQKFEIRNSRPVASMQLSGTSKAGKPAGSW